MDFKWSFSKDKKLKCLIDFEKENLRDDEQFIKYYINRKFLKFNITLFKEPLVAQCKSSNSMSDSFSTVESPTIKACSTNFLMDLYLTRGTPLVF
jgi:hypothetical protein